MSKKIDYEVSKAWELHREHKGSIDPDIDPIGFEVERRAFEVGYLTALVAVLNNKSNIIGRFKQLAISVRSDHQV